MLNRTGGGGDPDLHAYWSDSATPDFAAPSGFDFQDTSVGSQPLTRRTVAKKDFGADFQHPGIFLCVHAYGNQGIQVSLAAMLTPCPSSFAPDGAQLECSSPVGGPEEGHRFSECTAAECVCKPPFDRPVPVVFPGLGFEDCSARTLHLGSQLSAAQPFVAHHERLAPDAWAFYSFEIHPDDFQVVVTVVERGEARVDLFLKAGAPPGDGPQQFDLRPKWNAATRDRQLQVDMGPADPGFRTGRWFVGVVADDAEAEYALTIAKYGCPFNCSGNGDCDGATHVCTCAPGFGGKDCALVSAPLEYGTIAGRNATAAFEFEFYSMPPVTDTMLAGNVEVVIEAVFSSNRYSQHLAAQPAVLVAATGDGSFPTAANFTHRLVLDQQGVPRSLALCASQLKLGDWKLAVYNPLPTAPINYSMTVRREGRCLNACSRHGECSEEGVCHCASGWAGGDCSVPSAGGGGRGHSAFGALVWAVLCMGLGAAAALAFVHVRGVPSWLPIRSGGFGGIGLYQELTEHEGI